MSVLVVGISHKSAPVELLERLAMDPDGAVKLVADAVAGENVTEAAAIVTCNRLEVYAQVDRFHGSVEDLSGEAASATHLRVGCDGEAGAALPPVLAAVADAGAVVSQVELGEPTLEDVFIDLTGRGLR